MNKLIHDLTKTQWAPVDKVMEFIVFQPPKALDPENKDRWRVNALLSIDETNFFTCYQASSKEDAIRWIKELYK